MRRQAVARHPRRHIGSPGGTVPFAPAAQRGPPAVVRLRGRLRGILAEAAKFGTVGGVATVVDVGAFNLFRVVLGAGPLVSTVVSMTIATTVSFVGNRQWTFQNRARRVLTLQYGLFVSCNAAAIAITLACVGVSHYLLGFTSPAADNYSKNVVGLAAATLFRFWSYRTWVFPHGRNARRPSAGRTGPAGTVMHRGETGVACRRRRAFPGRPASPQVGSPTGAGGKSRAPRRRAPNIERPVGHEPSGMREQAH